MRSVWMRAATSRRRPQFSSRRFCIVAASLASSLLRIYRISAIRRTLTVVLALCADSFLLHGRGNNRMAALIKSHPGLKPLEEVDSEMSELIAQEQRRQVPRAVSETVC